MAQGKALERAVLSLVTSYRPHPLSPSIDGLSAGLNSVSGPTQSARVPELSFNKIGIFVDHSRLDSQVKEPRVRVNPNWLHHEKSKHSQVGAQVKFSFSQESE